MKIFTKRYALLGWIALFFAKRYMKRRMRSRTA
jgi:hypothetical protein